MLLLKQSHSKCFASKLRLKLLNTCRTNTLAIEINNVICVVAKNASRLIFLQDDSVAVSEDLNSVLLLDVQHLSDFDRKHDSSKFIYLAYYSGGLHKDSPLHNIIRGVSSAFDTISRLLPNNTTILYKIQRALSIHFLRNFVAYSSFFVNFLYNY